MPVNEPQESGGDVRFHVSAEGRVEPYDLSFSVSLFPFFFVLLFSTEYSHP